MYKIISFANRFMSWKHSILKLVGYTSKREFYSNKCLHLDKRKISNKQPNVTPQETIKGIDKAPS